MVFETSLDHLKGFLVCSKFNDIDGVINHIKNRYYSCFNIEFFRIDSFGTIIYLKNTCNYNFNNHYFQSI